MKMKVGKEIAKNAAEVLGLSKKGVVCETKKGTNGQDSICVRIVQEAPKGEEVKAVAALRIDGAVNSVLKGDMTAKEAGEKVANMIRDSKNILAGDIGIDRDYILRECRTKVVSLRKNQSDIKDKPFRIICDLAEMLIVPVSIRGEEPDGVIHVDNSFLELFGITEEEAFEAARKNVAEHVVFKDMSEMGLPGGSEEGFLYVLTNESCLYGASAIACPDIIRECMDKMGSDVYIIPSSVHEILLCRKEDCDDAAGIVDIIGMVNGTQVAPDEVLSGHLYGANADGRVYIEA